MLKQFTDLQVRLAEINKDEEGATMVEYGLIVALIAVVVAVTAKILGDDIAALFTEVSADL